MTRSTQPVSIDKPTGERTIRWKSGQLMELPTDHTGPLLGYEWTPDDILIPTAHCWGLGKAMRHSGREREMRLTLFKVNWRYDLIQSACLPSTGWTALRARRADLYWAADL